jgi:hypothetical protein
VIDADERIVDRFDRLAGYVEAERSHRTLTACVAGRVRGEVGELCHVLRKPRALLPHLGLEPRSECGLLDGAEPRRCHADGPAPLLERWCHEEPHRCCHSAAICCHPRAFSLVFTRVNL